MLGVEGRGVPLSCPVLGLPAGAGPEISLMTSPWVLAPGKGQTAMNAWWPDGQGGAIPEKGYLHAEKLLRKNKVWIPEPAPPLTHNEPLDKSPDFDFNLDLQASSLPHLASETELCEQHS